ncbi:hypothetical protein C8R48DRAFT_770422 [Suillus tomentosus]|nr:hypothetical protein C8R48DRAFT_770422 [Suillus tomentosus]
MLSNSHFTPFSTAQANGLIVVPAFAFLSALALAFIVFRSIHLVVIPSFQRNGPACKAPENLFFRTQLGHYAASLVLSNVFLTAAGLMEFFWVKQSGIHQGSMCTFQAVLMQIGYWSTCFFSVAIGVHTCNSLVFRLYQISYLSVVVIAFGWIMSLLIALAPISQAGVYGPVTVSCGVMTAYPGKIFGLEAFPVILVSVLSVIIYSPIFLFLGGILHVKGGIKLTCKAQGRRCAVTDSEDYHRFLAAVAKTMFWYPVAFVSLLLPIAAVNMAQSSGRVIPFGAEVFAHVCSSMLGLVNVGLMYNTFRVLSPVFHCSTLPKIQVDTETFGNNAFDESPILPAVAHMPKGPLLPLYNDTSKAISPVSLSDFPPVQYHSRNSSTASTDSATHLLSTKRTPSRFHKMRVRQGESLLPLSRAILTPSELNRQLDAASDTESLKGRNLRINLPQMAEVNTPRMAVVTVSLSPAPRSSTASVVTSSPIVPTSIQSSNPSPIMRQFTAAFGRPSRKLSMFGSQSKRSGKIPLILTKSVSRLRVPSIKRRPTPLDLTDAIPTPVIRPLPVITTKAEALQKVDKGKGRAPPSPTTLVERDVISRSHAALRQLPQLPRNSTGSSSSSAHSRPEAATSAAPHERHGSISSLLSISSISSFLDSLHSTHSTSSVGGGSEKALPSIPLTRGNTIESMDSESSLSSSFEKHKQSERSTWMTVWSQDSAVTLSQPPDEETMLAYASLVPGASVTKGDQASVENVPRREDISPVPRAPIPFALRPGHSMVKLSGIPPSLRT